MTVAPRVRSVGIALQETREDAYEHEPTSKVYDITIEYFSQLVFATELTCSGGLMEEFWNPEVEGWE